MSGGVDYFCDDKIAGRFRRRWPLPPRAPAALPQTTDADGDDVPIACGFLEVSRRISKRLASKVDRPTAPQFDASIADDQRQKSLNRCGDLDDIICHGGYPPQQEAAPVSPERSTWIGGHGTEP